METFLETLATFLNRELFRIGETPLTPGAMVVFLAIVGGFAVASRVFRQAVLQRALRRMRVDEGTQFTVLRVAHYMVVTLGVLVAFQTVGVDLSGIVVVFGLLSVGIGFGLQNITSNFISGLILLFERPIRVGDRVTVGGTEGDVVEINMRATIIRSLHNISIIVPNSDFVSTQVVNWSHRDPRIRLDLDVGVSYASDLDTVLRTLREVAESHEAVLRDPAPDVLHLGFGDSAWNMRLRVWIDEPKRHPVIRSELNCAIVRAFAANGVEIPFPQRDLHVRSSVRLPVATAGDAAEGA